MKRHIIFILGYLILTGCTAHEDNGFIEKNWNNPITNFTSNRSKPLLSTISKNFESINGNSGISVRIKYRLTINVYFDEQEYTINNIYGLL